MNRYILAAVVATLTIMALYMAQNGVEPQMAAAFVYVIVISLYFLIKDKDQK